MNPTSLIAAFMGADVGEMQLAVASRLARHNPQNSSSVTKLVDAAQQSFQPLASVAAGVGTNLDISA